MDLVGVLIAGAVIALIASLIRRGKTGLPWWGTWLAGIGGAAIGFWLAVQLGVASTSGIDWLRWAISVGVALVLIALAQGLVRRR